MNQNRRRFKLIAGVGALYVLVTACATWQAIVRDIKGKPAPNRGVYVNHDLHASEGMECSDCHDMYAGERMSLADHDTCTICHEIPEDSLLDASKYVQDVSCDMCHTRDDFSVVPTNQLITDEIIFDHELHTTAEVSCAECHGEPDYPMHTNTSLMTACMDCHEQTEHRFAGVAQSSVDASSYQANDCTVCHRELTEDTIPQYRHGQRIAHDSPQAWKKLHGQESVVDPAYCAQCHVEEEDCMTCHRTTKPDSHTLAWNRKLHGAHAVWDSQSCSVCHEEDSCIKCHKHTQPRSHRANFAAPRNNHCVQCHVPADTSCTVCHESIEHLGSPPSPHNDGGFTGNCSECHPGGIAGTPPHRTNLTISCRSCHR